MVSVGSFPLPVTVLKGALLRGSLITPITHRGNSYCKGNDLRCLVYQSAKRLWVLASWSIGCCENYQNSRLV